MARFVETLVIGAGPAGLAIADKLSKQGRDVVVLEAGPVCAGGVSRTMIDKSFLSDIEGLARRNGRVAH